MDIATINRTAWNAESSQGSDWSTPVDAETIKKARQGDWQVILTPVKPVPAHWFGATTNQNLLGLASGGGQQMPILAAAGFKVTSFDNSDEQLAKDALVAQRDSLAIELCQGDMADLSVFDDQQFDLIFHPVSNCFVPDVDVVWRECYRVLKPGGRLLAAFMNPAYFMFDHDQANDSGQLIVQHPLPYSDLEAPQAAQQKLLEQQLPFEFSHTLERQIGGQLAAGFSLTGFYEDKWSDSATPLNRFMATSIATLAIKA